MKLENRKLIYKFDFIFVIIFSLNLYKKAALNLEWKHLIAFMNEISLFDDSLT